jgi:hypothetical protein
MASDDPTLADIKAKLYALPPDEFTKARDAAATQAPGPLARRIKALRRPTLSAWLVNLLAVKRPDELDRLLAIGEQLRQAHQAGRGQELRELSARRQAVITSLVALARDLAAEQGRTVRDDAAWEAEGTLRAALADPDVAELVREGALLRPVEYSGLGLPAMELTEQVADDGVPVEKPGAGRRATLRVIVGGRRDELEQQPGEWERGRRKPGKTAPGKAAPGKTAVPSREAEREAEREERARRAAAALAEAEQSLEAAAAAEREATRRLGEIAGEFDELRVRERRLRGQQAEAERDRRRAQRRREAAEKAVADARRRLR